MKAVLIKDKLFIGGILYKGGPIDDVIEKAVLEKNKHKGGNEGVKSGGNSLTDKNSVEENSENMVDRENSMQVA